MTAAAGDLLGGRYRLDALLAAGGMGEVWTATDTALGREVAVKLLRPGAPDPAAAERLLAEARAGGRLRSPRVVQVHDLGEHTGTDGRGTPYLVMELVPGQSLAGALRVRSPLPAAEVAAVVGQVAEALVEAHAAGLVHRDVKPGNVLVQPSGDVKLADFGIARAQDSAALTGTGLLLGTARYVSPEQVGGAAAGPASDVYALGVVAFECLTGLPPFGGDSELATAIAHVQQPVPPLPEGVPSPLDALVPQMLAKDPADRPTAAQVAGQLVERGAGATRALAAPGLGAAPLTAVTLDDTSAVSGAALSAPDEPTTIVRRAARTDRRRRAGLLAAAAGVVALAAGGTLLAVSGTHGSRTPAVAGSPAPASTSAPASRPTLSTAQVAVATHAPTPTARTTVRSTVTRHTAPVTPVAPAQPAKKHGGKKHGG